MLNFLRFACLASILAAAAPAGAQDKPVQAPEVGAVAASPVVPAPPPASAAAPVAPFKVDKPSLDDLKDRPPELAEASDSLIGSLLQMVLVLGLVLALVYLTLNWGMRKLMRLGPVRGAMVKVHERVPLDAKKTVYLVEAGGEYLLLGAGEHEVSFLTRLDAERMRAALEKRADQPGSAPALKGKPFWERLLIKPSAKKSGPGEEQGGPAAS